MDKIKLIYVCTDNIGAVVEGQVYKLLEHYQTLEDFSDIVLLQPYISQDNLNKAKEVLKKYSFRVVFYYFRPLAPNKYFANIRSLNRVLEQELTPNSVIHTRGSFTSPLIRRALPKPYKDMYILTEFRGLVLDEIKVAHQHRVIDYLLAYCVKYPYGRWLLKRLYKEKDVHITAVSPLFKETIAKEGVPQDRICVHPNIVSPDFVYSDNDRNSIREKYGISEKQPVAVLSSSGGQAWQNDKAVLEKLLDLGFVVFNLGKNRMERENVINAFLPRSEMPKYLAAADVAVLWREDIPLNNVACPSKFGEFVTMGLYVIHNGTVDIAKRFIEDNDAGIIVKTPVEIKIDMSKINLEVRKNRCAAGYNMFSVECIAKSYISHYINKN